MKRKLFPILMVMLAVLLAGAVQTNAPSDDIDIQTEQVAQASTPQTVALSGITIDLNIETRFVASMQLEQSQVVSDELQVSPNTDSEVHDFLIASSGDKDHQLFNLQPRQNLHAVNHMWFGGSLPDPGDQIT